VFRQGPIDESLLSLKLKRVCCAAAWRDVIIECRIDDLANNNNSATVRSRVALRLFSPVARLPDVLGRNASRDAAQVNAQGYTMAKRLLPDALSKSRTALNLSGWYADRYPSAGMSDACSYFAFYSDASTMPIHRWYKRIIDFGMAMCGTSLNRRRRRSLRRCFWRSGLGAPIIYRRKGAC
jgi:hypothetical protein